MTRAKLREREAYALDAVFPHLEEYLARMDVAPYIIAPISSDDKWEQFVDTLETFGETSSEGAGIVERLLRRRFVDASQNSAPSKVDALRHTHV